MLMQQKIQCNVILVYLRKTQRSRLTLALFRCLAQNLQKLRKHAQYMLHSFITSIYIAPVHGNYSGALPTHPRLKSSFEIATEHLSMDPGQQTQVWREPIPGRRASNRESAPLPDRNSRIGDKMLALRRRAKRTVGLDILGGTTKLP